MKRKVLVLLWCACSLIGCEKPPPAPDAVVTSPISPGADRVVSARQYETELGHFDCEAHSPLELLQYLQLKQQELPPDTFGSVTVWASPSWIKREHLAPLADRLDSKELCVPVVSMLSSYLPREPSTAGQEAAFLMEGFRKGKYPPALVSESVDIAAVKAWWSEYLRNQP